MTDFEKPSFILLFSISSTFPCQAILKLTNLGISQASKKKEFQSIVASSKLFLPSMGI